MNFPYDLYCDPSADDVASTLVLMKNVKFI